MAPTAAAATAAICHPDTDDISDTNCTSECEESEEFCESSASRSPETAVQTLFRIRSIRNICSISHLTPPLQDRDSQQEQQLKNPPFRPEHRPA